MLRTGAGMGMAVTLDAGAKVKGASSMISTRGDESSSMFSLSEMMMDEVEVISGELVNGGVL